MINSIFSTISFLTIIPVSSKVKPSYKLFPFFPVVGLILGLLCGYCFKFSKMFFDEKTSIFFSLVLYIISSDILHLDGFVDTIDVLFAQIKKDYESVFKDPHIGVAGCVYLVLLLCTKYILFVNLNTPFLAFLITPLVSRWSMSIVGFFGNTLEWSELGSKFVYKDIKILFYSLITATTCLLIISKNFFIIPILILTFLASFIFTKFFNHKLGGINGDIFGFVSEIVEVLVLLIFTFWR